jgi:hypothetical protein
MASEYQPTSMNIERIPNRWIGAAQGAWAILTALTISLVIAGIPYRYGQVAQTADRRSLTGLGFSGSTYAAMIVGLSLIVVLAHILIAAFIFFRRPNDWMALFVSLALVANGANVPLSSMGPPAFVSHVIWNFLVGIITFLALSSSLTLLYVFPDGRFSPEWTRWLALVWTILILFAIFTPNSPLSLTTWPALILILFALIWSASGGYSQAHRYIYKSSPVQRQQVKWAFLGLSAAALGPLVYLISTVILPTVSGPDVPNILYQRVGVSFFAVSLLVRLIGSIVVTFYLLLFPISFAIAILRYRLWDIDLLIRRTLIYSVLTGLLVMIYFGTVVLMQTAFRYSTGKWNSEIVTVLSTLAIAALFVPLRHRVQNWIDRRFYQRKYDAAKTLLSFSQLYGMRSTWTSYWRIMG